MSKKSHKTTFVALFSFVFRGIWLENHKKPHIIMLILFGL